jgi:hypothetical protein
VPNARQSPNSKVACRDYRPNGSRYLGSAKLDQTLSFGLSAIGGAKLANGLDVLGGKEPCAPGWFRRCGGRGNPRMTSARIPFAMRSEPPDQPHQLEPSNVHGPRIVMSKPVRPLTRDTN